MRRKDYESKNLSEVIDLLQTCWVGHLATVSQEGIPTVRPMNFIYYHGLVYFHGAKAGAKYRDQKRPASFCVYRPLSWIPSYWFDPKLACPATNYYQSVVVEGPINVIENIDIKALILEAFMEKYQKEGNYLPFLQNKGLYLQSLKGTFIFGLTVNEKHMSYKCKIGQNLKKEILCLLQSKLKERGKKEDHALLELMAKYQL